MFRTPFRRNAASPPEDEGAPRGRRSSLLGRAEHAATTRSACVLPGGWAVTTTIRAASDGSYGADEILDYSQPGRQASLWILRGAERRRQLVVVARSFTPPWSPPPSSMASLPCAGSPTLSSSATWYSQGSRTLVGSPVSSRFPRPQTPVDPPGTFRTSFTPLLYRYQSPSGGLSYGGAGFLSPDNGTLLEGGHRPIVFRKRAGPDSPGPLSSNRLIWPNMLLWDELLYEGVGSSGHDLKASLDRVRDVGSRVVSNDRINTTKSFENKFGTFDILSIGSLRGSLAQPVHLSRVIALAQALKYYEIHLLLDRC